MELLLGGLAALIMISYAIYSWQILRERALDFEQSMMESLAEWMLARGKASQSVLWALLALSGLMVGVYFLLVLSILTNPVIRIASIAFIGVELYHFSSSFWRFRRFFAGQTTIMQLLNWKVERLCALLYTAHALLVLVCLIFSL